MEVRDQQIVVITDFSEYSLFALKHAQILAQLLEKGLYIACFVQENTNEEQAKAALHAFALNTSINTYLIKGYNKNAISNMIDSISAILLVLTSDIDNSKSFLYPKKILKILKHSRVPYIFVNSDITDVSYYSKVLLPIDSTKESKEKVLWASYFGRFNNSYIQVISSFVKDEYLYRQLNNNLKFIRKIFSNFEVSYEINETDQKEHNLDFYALNKANAEKAGLLILMMGNYKNFIDLFAGPREISIINNSKGIAVLCLNKREDLYIICD